MKKLITIAAAAAVVAMASTSFAAGTSSATLNTSATVIAGCKATAGAEIAFGSLDPMNDPDVKNAATKGSVTVQCTEGTAYSFAYDMAAVMTGPGGVTIPVYPVENLVPQLGTVAGTSYDVDAQVKKVDYAAAPVGAYNGTFTLTVNY